MEMISRLTFVLACALTLGCVTADPPLPVTPLSARFAHATVCIDDVRMDEEEGRPQLTSPRSSIPSEIHAALNTELTTRGFAVRGAGCFVHLRVLYAYGAVRSFIHGHAEADVATCGRWIGRLVLAHREVSEDDVAADVARAVTNGLVDLLDSKRTEGTGCGTD